MVDEIRCDGQANEKKEINLHSRRVDCADVKEEGNSLQQRAPTALERETGRLLLGDYQNLMSNNGSNPLFSSWGHQCLQ